MADIELRIGLDVIRSYRRLAYTPWHALAEFVDNSTQSYRNNRIQLDKAYKAEETHLVVTVKYDRDAGVLVVVDNAMGMSLQELKNAVYIGKPPTITSGRSQFGLGLKTAACWFGDKWTVRTKKLGESVGHEITVEVDAVASGQPKLPNTTFPAEAQEHFTEIRIEQLHAKLQGRRLGKTKDSLRSMYRVDIREGKLEIIWDTSPLVWLDDLTFLTEKDGKEAKQPIRFNIGKRKVTGWVGVLAPGSSGRTKAGFALIRRGRLIRGWPEAWRPEAIFGPPPGSNDLINQRIAGEIHLDDFDVTHTKDDILWEENEEDEVQEGIKERIEDLLILARTYRQPPLLKQPPRVPRLVLDAILEDSEMVSRLTAASAELEATVSALPPAQVLEATTAAVVKAIAGERVGVQMPMDGQVLKLVSTSGIGGEKPYYAAYHGAAKSWIVAINAAHVMCANPDNSDAFRTHVQHVLADGIVMWAVSSGKMEGNPFLLLYLKDAILRAIAGGEDT